MKQQVSHFLRTYPVTLTLVIGIWTVCLIPIPETPLSDVALMDKWTHIALYFVLTSCIYWEDLKSQRPLTSKRLFIIAFLTPLLMGGLIEVVQAGRYKIAVDYIDKKRMYRIKKRVIFEVEALPAPGRDE